MAGTFWFLPILRIGPIPTRATPGLNGQSSCVASRLSQRTSASCHRLLSKHHAS
jgi:hypothetical protein